MRIQGIRTQTTEPILGMLMIFGTNKLQPLLQYAIPSRGACGYRLIYRGSCPLT